MKKIFLSILAIAILVPMFMNAANTPIDKTISVDAKAKIITPITLVNTSSQSLDFGTITPGSLISVIIVDAVESPTKNVFSGDAYIISSSTQTAAKFTIGGQSSYAYTIELPSTTTINGGVGNDLTIFNITCSNGLGGSIGTNNTFYVGGSLIVPSDAVATNYSGTFDVTVSYN